MCPAFALRNIVVGEEKMSVVCKSRERPAAQERPAGPAPRIKTSADEVCVDILLVDFKYVVPCLGLLLERGVNRALKSLKY